MTRYELEKALATGALLRLTKNDSILLVSYASPDPNGWIAAQLDSGQVHLDYTAINANLIAAFLSESDG